MHVQISREDSARLRQPQIGEFVHGTIERRGQKGQIVRVAIENGFHLKSRTIPRDPGFPDAAKVECLVHSYSGAIVNLEVVRTLDLADL